MMYVPKEKNYLCIRQVSGKALSEAGIIARGNPAGTRNNPSLPDTADNF
jgi:hypothetical protein